MNNTEYLQSKILKLLELSFMDEKEREAWIFAVPRLPIEKLEELEKILAKEVLAFADLAMKQKVNK